MDPWTFNVISRPMRDCQGLLVSRREPLAKNLADLKKPGAAQQEPSACLAAALGSFRPPMSIDQQLKTGEPARSSQIFYDMRRVRFIRSDTMTPPRPSHTVSRPQAGRKRFAEPAYFQNH